MKFKFGILYAAVLLVFSGCGQNQNFSLKSADVSSSQVGNISYLNLDAIAEVGNLRFPNLDVPILNSSTSERLGLATLRSLPDGTNRLAISIDYEAALHLDPSLGRTLPNGSDLPPTLEIDPCANIVGIPILEFSRIYVGADDMKNIYIGAAIAVSTFDTVLNRLPFPLNIFYSFSLSNLVKGFAGLFTGTQAGQNGLGVFVKKLAAPASAGDVSTRLFPAGDDEIRKLPRKTRVEINRLLKKKVTIQVH